LQGIGVFVRDSSRILLESGEKPEIGSSFMYQL